LGHRGLCPWPANLSHISYDLMMETGAFSQALPFPANHWRLNYSFYRNIREDGVAV
jgi:hypothetical protein